MNASDGKGSSRKINAAERAEKDRELAFAIESRFGFARPCCDQKRQAHAIRNPRYVRKYTVYPVDKPQAG